MKKILTSRQLSMILFISVISLKFLVFPALVTNYAKRDAYIAVFLYLLIEFAVVFGILCFMKKYQDLTFKDVLIKTYGNIFAKVVFAILFVYFLFKTLFLIKETHNYILEVIFDDLPWIYFTLPLTAYLVYVMSKSIKTMARTMEIMFWVIIVCIGLTVIAPSYRIDLLNIFPVFENGFLPVLKGMLFSSFSFGDFLLLLLFMGKIKFEKGTIKRVSLYGLFCVVFVTVFYAIFIAIFDNSGINHILAISDISVRSSYPYTQEKLDWLAILIWTIVLLFQIGVYAIVTKNCLKEVFTFKTKFVPIAIIAVLLFIMSLLLYLNLELVVKISSSLPFVIVVISIHLFMIVLLIISSIVLKIKKVDANNNNLNFQSGSIVKKEKSKTFKDVKSKSEA